VAVNGALVVVAHLLLEKNGAWLAAVDGVLVGDDGTSAVLVVGIAAGSTARGP
jgi:predicted exporter